MFQGEHDLFHRHMPFEDHPTRIEQHKAGHQAQDQMPVGGVFGSSLTGLSGSQVFQDAEHLLDPLSLIPGLNQPRHLDRQGHRDQIKWLFTGLIDHDEEDLTIGWTPGAQPHRAAARCMKTLLPGPIVGLDHVRAFDLASVFQGEGRGAFALHQQGALMRVGDVAHQLGVAEPTLGHDHRGGELKSALGKSCQALIEQALGQAELVLAASPGAFGIGATDGKVDRDDQCAIAKDDQEEHPIDTGHSAFELATVPGADEPALPAVFPEDGIIDDPSPLPATAGGGTFVLGMAPHGDENLKAQAPQAFEPGSFGQSAEKLRRDMLVPPAHARKFMAMSATKERGKHERDDCAQEFLLSPQTAFALGHQGLGEVQVLQGLMEGLDRVLGLSALSLEALLGFESTAFSGFDLFVGVSFHGGHGELLRTVLLFL